MANRLTSKGQVTVPLKVRNHLGLAAGDAVEFRITGDGVVQVVPVARPVTTAPTSRFATLRGRATVKLSTDDIMALTRGAATTLERDE